MREPKARIRLPDGEGGTQWFQDVRVEDLYVLDTIAGEISEFTIDMANEDGALNYLSTDEEIKIEMSDDGGQTWSHVLLGRIEAPRSVVSTDGVFKRISGNNYGKLLEERTVAQVYTNITVEDLIVKELIDRQVPELTTNNVSVPDLTLDKIILANDTVKEALEKIQDILEGEYVYFVDKNKDFHFEPEGSTFSGKSLEYGKNIAEAEIGYDNENLVNFALIYGSNKSTRFSQTETFDGTEQTFKTDFKPGAVKIENTSTGEVLAGGIEGVHDLSNGRYDYLVDYQNKEITVEPQTADEDAQITYNKGHPVFASRRDVKSIRKYGEKREQVMGNAIETEEGAQRLADQLVEKFSEPLLRGDATISGIVDLKAGESVDVKIPSQEIDARLSMAEVEYEYDSEVFTQSVVLNEKLGDVEETIRNHESRLKTLEAEISGSLEVVPKFVFPNEVVAVQDSGTVEKRSIGQSFIVGRSLIGSSHLFETNSDTDTDKGFDRGTTSGNMAISSDTLTLSGDNSSGTWTNTLQRNDIGDSESTWREIEFDVTEPADTSVQVNVKDSSGNLLIEDVASGTNLKDVQGTKDENLEIEVEMVSNSTSGNVPTMERLEVNFKPALIGNQAGSWETEATF